MKFGTGIDHGTRNDFCYGAANKKSNSGCGSQYVTLLRKNGLIAGLAKIDFFPEKAFTKFSTAYAKYEHFTKLCFHAMTLNNRTFAIIAVLMFEETAPRLLLGGA